MITIYGMTNSGNCYKPRLLLAKLGVKFRHVETASGAAGTKSSAFLARNPNGRVPLLEFDDGRVLAESNAMLLHLAEAAVSCLLTPTGARSPINGCSSSNTAMSLMSLSAEHCSSCRTAPPTPRPSGWPRRLPAATRRWAVMEEQLARTPFFAGDELSVADLALYAYTHDAGAGGFDLKTYPAVTAWLQRVAADPGHVPMDWTG